MFYISCADFERNILSPPVEEQREDNFTSTSRLILELLGFCFLNFFMPYPFIRILHFSQDKRLHFLCLFIADATLISWPLLREEKGSESVRINGRCKLQIRFPASLLSSISMVFIIRYNPCYLSYRKANKPQDIIMFGPSYC